MRERLRNWLPLLPLLLLLGATYWLNRQVQSTALAPDNNLRHDPDYIVDNFTATTLDKKGKIRFVMSAQKMVHYPDDDTTHMEAPKLSSLAAERPPMHMSALNGKISSKGDEVFLHDNVTIVRPAYGGRSEFTFNTNYLHVIPNKNIADTNQAVTMNDARSTLKAVGMELDNNTHIIKFLSQVNIVYESPKK